MRNIILAMVCAGIMSCATQHSTQRTTAVNFTQSALATMRADDILQCPSPLMDACMASTLAQDCPRLFLDAAIDAANRSNEDVPVYNPDSISDWARRVHRQYGVPDSTLVLITHQRFHWRWAWYSAVAGSPTPETLLSTNRTEALAQLNGEYALKEKALKRRLPAMWAKAQAEYARLSSLFAAIDRLSAEARR